MKSASLGAVATVFTCCFIFANSARATNNVDFSNVRPGLSGTTGGSVAMNPIFNLGRSVAINSYGRFGVPSDALFSGTFAGPVTWTVITVANGTHDYSVSGVAVAAVAGKLADAINLQLTIHTGKGFFQSSAFIADGDTAFASGNVKTVSSIPEPSALSLLLTGTLGVLAVMRRKQVTRSARN